MTDVLSMLERAATPEGGGVLERLESAATSPGDVAQQVVGSFMRGVEAPIGALHRLGQRVSGAVLPQSANEVLWAVPNMQMALARAATPEAVPGMEDSFLATTLPEMAGQTAAMAPAALGGPWALAGAGAAVGLEQGVEEAQAAKAGTTDTVLAALGNAVLGATSAYGPAKALQRLGLKPGSAPFNVVHDILVPAAQGGAQSVGTDLVAKGTYDPKRAIDVGRAVEAALASGIAGGGTGGVVRLLEVAAGGGAGPKGTNAEPTGTNADQSATGLPEPAPADVDLTGGKPSMAEQESALQGQLIRVSPSEQPPTVTPAEAIPPAPDVVPPETAAGASRTQPIAASSEAAAGVSRFTNDHIDTIGRGENKMELVARDAVGRPLGVAEYTQVGDQVSIDMVTVRDDLRRRGIGKRLIEEVKKANPQATINLGMAVSEAGEALRSASERDLSNTYQTTEPAPAPESTIRAPMVEEPVRDAGAESDPADVRMEGTAERGPDQPVKPTREQAARGEDADTIALRHETTAAQRAARGFDKYERSGSRSDETLRSKAIEALRKDPFAGKKLVDEIEATRRIPDDEETFLLLAESNRLRNEAKLAQVENNSNPTPENEARLNAALADFKRTMEVTDVSGSQKGRSFRVLAQQMREDYSLAGMVRKKADGIGRSLTSREMEAIAKNASKLDELESRVAEVERMDEERAAQAAADERVAALKREARARAPRKNASVERSKARMDEILRELAKPVASAQAFLDPKRVSLAVEFIGHAINVGVRTFGDFVKEYGERLGDDLRPKLQELWNEATKAHREELTATVRARFKAGEKPGRALDDLALYLVESGVTEREALIDALHKAVPEATRVQVRDALSRYGEFRQASTEESKVRLREIKQESQKVAQIEALEKRMAPLKTGFDRGEPSNEYRRLAKRVDELKKQVGIRVVDPATALKTAERTRETYLRNRIADLKDEIAAGKREARVRGEPPTNETIKALEAELAAVEAEHAEKFPEPVKTEEQKKQDELARRIAAIDAKIKAGDTSRGKATVDTAEVAALRKQLREKSAQLAAMRPKAEGADPRVKALEESIAGLRKKLETGDLSTRGAKQGPDTAEVESLKKQREALQAQLDLARREPVNETTPDDILAKRARQRAEAAERTAKAYEAQIANMDFARRQSGSKAPIPEAIQARLDAARATIDELRAIANPKATPEERANKAALTRLRNETAAIQQRMTFKEYGPRVRVERTPSPEVIAAKAEYESVRRQFEREVFRDQQARRSTARKALDAAVNVWNLPKALWSSFDVSAVFRQGGFFSGQDLFFRPQQFAVRIGRMFRALAREEFANRIDVQMREHPDFATAMRAGLELTSEKINAREELFQSTLSDKIPGVKQSERAYRTYLDMLRFEHFTRILSSTDRSPEAAKSVANLVNVATGRGNVGKGAFARAMPAAGAVLWAPRLYVSRFQLLLGQPLMRGGARKAVAMEYAKSLAALGAVYALANIYSAMNPDDPDRPQVSMDPTSPDGGKIRMGDTRVDPLAGLAQVSRLLSREAVIVGQAAKGEKAKEDAAEVFLRFLRTKVSPSISLPYELATGKDFAYGRAVDRSETVRDALVPLSFRDIEEVMEDQGVPKGIAIGLLSLFGVSVNVYEDKKKPATLPVATR